MNRVSQAAAAAVLTTVLVPAGSAQAQQQFNGNWSVQVITEKGECNKTYSLPVVIEDGRARYPGAVGTDALGSVSRAGVVRASFSWGGTQADIKGRLSGKAGSGTWATTGARGCSGRWIGERQS